MRIHEILALVPPEARELFESLREERKAGKTESTLEGLLEQYDGNLRAALESLDKDTPVVLLTARRETPTAVNILLLQ